jgi:hypothetical protein
MAAFGPHVARLNTRDFTRDFSKQTNEYVTKITIHEYKIWILQNHKFGCPVVEGFIFLCC